jgi:hypothetical protein
MLYHALTLEGVPLLLVVMGEVWRVTVELRSEVDRELA